jgi:hypothetical protein
MIYNIPLNTQINLNYIYQFNAYRAVNTPRLGYKNGTLMLYVEVNLLYFFLRTTQDTQRHYAGRT